MTHGFLLSVSLGFKPEYKFVPFGGFQRRNLPLLWPIPDTPRGRKPLQ